MGSLLCYNLYIMEIKYIDNNTIVTGQADFELSDIFDCGQCFRFSPSGDDEYTGVAFSKALTVKKSGEDIIFFDTSPEDFKSVWFDYFDFGRDYGAVKQAIGGEGCMDRAVSEGGGIRILRQDLFETIISFIISQSNNIPRIKGIIETLCRIAGEKILYRGKEYYSFPSPEAILNCDISALRAGYRDKYIISAAKLINEKPEFLHELQNASTEDAKKMLMRMTGVGNKVSDCILLFGLGKTNSFPVDVWMKRIMERLYFKRSCSVGEISSYAREKFGDYSGFAQQYLFYYALNHKSELTAEEK